MSFVWFPTVVWCDNSKLVNIANNWIFCAVWLTPCTVSIDNAMNNVE
jgi:hypothetical protein